MSKPCYHSRRAAAWEKVHTSATWFVFFELKGRNLQGGTNYDSANGTEPSPYLGIEVMTRLDRVSRTAVTWVTHESDGRAFVIRSVPKRNNKMDVTQNETPTTTASRNTVDLRDKLNNSLHPEGFLARQIKNCKSFLASAYSVPSCCKPAVAGFKGVVVS